MRGQLLSQNRSNAPSSSGEGWADSMAGRMVCTAMLLFFASEMANDFDAACHRMLLLLEGKNGRTCAERETEAGAERRKGETARAHHAIQKS